MVMLMKHDTNICSGSHCKCDKMVKDGHDLNSLSYEQLYILLDVVTNADQGKDPILIGHSRNVKGSVNSKLTVRCCLCVLAC